MASTTEQEVTKDSSRQRIIEYCKNPPDNKAIAREIGCQWVTKLSDNSVVKSGSSLGPGEAKNQQFARQYLDMSIVYVPEVYSYFKDDEGHGYIVMEYISGQRLDSTEEPIDFERLAEIVNYLHSLHRALPYADEAGCGLLFEFSGAPNCNSMHDLAAWVHQRLPPKSPPVSFSGDPAVFCHMDIAPRNIILRGDGSICLLDWASAGFFPSCFEIATFQLYVTENIAFARQLLDTLKPSEQELEQAVIVRTMFSGCMFIAFAPYERPKGSVCPSISENVYFSNSEPPATYLYSPGI